MDILDVNLYQFGLICKDCFRKVVLKKEKGVELNALTPSISENNSKFLKISSLVPPPQTRTLTGLSYTPNCGCKGSALFLICK